MLPHAIGDALEGKKTATVKGTVVLMRKTVLGLDVTDIGAKVGDDLAELAGKGISFQLVSATVGDHNNGNRGKVGEVANLENWAITPAGLPADDSHFEVNFTWDEDFGVPGAVIVNNYHPTEFYLKTVTLENVPGKGRVQFVCSSWVYLRRSISTTASSSPTMAYDRVAIKFHGFDADINFNLSDYDEYVNQTRNLT